MFSYIFPESPENPSLLDRIEIKAPYITFYYNENVIRSQNELSCFLTSLFDNCSTVIGDAPIHGILHEVHIDRKDHQHFEVKTDDFMATLSQILDALFNRNENPVLRLNDKSELISRLNKERIGLGHEKLPEPIQKSIDAFNLHTPFVLSNDTDRLKADILKQYQDYLDSPSSLYFLELISVYLKKLMIKHYNYFDFDNNIENTALESRLKLLKKLKCLLISKNFSFPYNYHELSKIRSIIESINIEDIAKLEDSCDPYFKMTLRERLDKIRQHVDELLHPHPCESLLRECYRLGQTLFNQRSNLPVLQEKTSEIRPILFSNNRAQDPLRSLHDKIIAKNASSALATKPHPLSKLQ